MTTNNSYFENGWYSVLKKDIDKVFKSIDDAIILKEKKTEYFEITNHEAIKIMLNKSSHRHLALETIGNTVVRRCRVLIDIEYKYLSDRELKKIISK